MPELEFSPINDPAARETSQRVLAAVIGSDQRACGIAEEVSDENAAERAYRAGLHVVMNRCLKIEHARFAGGLHLAGFDTGVISSRRKLR